MTTQQKKGKETIKNSLKKMKKNAITHPKIKNR